MKCLWLVLLFPLCEAWSPTLALRTRTKRYAKNDDDDDDDELVNALSKLNVPKAQSKLGLDLKLDPLSDQQAAELKAEAMEIINDGFAEGLDEIDRLRENMKIDIARTKAQMDYDSNKMLKQESEALMKRIDRLTGNFLEETKQSREEIKLVAAADASGTSEVGVWGTVGGRAVVTQASQGLLGSVGSAKQAAEKEAKNANKDEMTDLKRSASALAALVDDDEPVVAATNRIIIVADLSDDPLAKQLLPAFMDQIEEEIPNLEGITVYRPTDTIPLGGDNAVCALLFLTSLSDRTTVSNILDRMLRRTIQPGGALGSPPTQLIGISQVGTERTDKFPYSMQNLMGGKLDNRRSMEEAVIATVQQADPQKTPLDYTILKFGEIKDAKDSFSLMPGDILDGTTPLETATNVLLQAVAYQPFARNATLCAVGNLPDEPDWEDTFLRLDGPEVKRWSLAGTTDFEGLTGYLKEWANNFAQHPKDLTTPIRVESCPETLAGSTVQKRAGLQLLFLPTATGSQYLSKQEERKREQARLSTTMKLNTLAKEGGLEIVVEITASNKLRVRAKRCNYPDGVPVKELSEATILKRLERAIEFWEERKK